MYEVIKNVILSGRYELADILKKIDTVWIQGGMTDTERTELIELAREKSTPDMGYADLQSQINDLRQRIEALEQAGGSGDTAEPEEYPAWKQPSGAHDAYYAGSKMTYTDGKQYICIAPDGFAVSYGPDTLPGMWQVVE